MVWHTLPEQILREDYALHNEMPEVRELELDNILAGIDTNHQWPRSDNVHSVFNLRHYITYGGHLHNCNILKPPWVQVLQIGPYRVDVCKLCKSTRTRSQAQCNDGHFQSKKHRTNVRAWIRDNKGISLHIGASTDQEATAAHASAVRASTPCANAEDVAWPPPPPPWPPPRPHSVCSSVSIPAGIESLPHTFVSADDDDNGILVLMPFTRSIMGTMMALQHFAFIFS